MHKWRHFFFPSLVLQQTRRFTYSLLERNNWTNSRKCRKIASCLILQLCSSLAVCFRADSWATCHVVSSIDAAPPGGQLQVSFRSIHLLHKRYWLFLWFFFWFVFQRSLHPLPFVHGIRLDLIPSESSKSWPTRRWRLARSLERKTKFIKTLTSKKERVWYSTRASRSWENIMSHFSLKWPSYTAEKMHCSWIPPPVMPPAFYEAVNQCEKEKEERKKKQQLAGCFKSYHSERELPDMQPE